MKKTINRIGRLGRDVKRLALGDGVPLLYFDKIDNVGDLVSVYLVEKISRQPVYRVETSLLPHLTAVGSTIGSSSGMTHVWGSGSIDGASPHYVLDPKKIHALRGKGTQALLERVTGSRLGVPLGDPAVLMPDFYDHDVPKTHALGLIPHFDEYDQVKAMLPAQLEGVKLIDVRQRPEAFIDELRSCSATMSSSLHGIILSDAYDVPCTWFSASAKLIGGEWKFNDYFTCTDRRGEAPLHVRTAEALLEAIEKARIGGRGGRFLESKSSLLNAFPARFCKR